jgi:hypothetical protein
LTKWCLSIISPLQYLSDDAIGGVGRFPTHFFGQKHFNYIKNLAKTWQEIKTPSKMRV